MLIEFIKGDSVLETSGPFTLAKQAGRVMPSGFGSARRALRASSKLNGEANCLLRQHYCTGPCRPFADR
jgi:hypothetical protein